MKATAKPFLYWFKKETKANGKYPVKLRITFQRKVKYYSIGIDMTEKEFEGYHLNKKLKHLFDDITFYQNKAEVVIDELKDGFTWELFEKGFLRKKYVLISVKTNEVLPAILAYIKVLREEGKISSSETYKHMHGHLSGFVGNNKLTFHSLDSQYLNSFDKYLRSKKLSNSTIGIFMRNLRSIYNIAIREKAVSAEFYPFGKNKYSPPASRVAKKSLSIEEIGKIFTYSPKSETESWAKDMWMFAYFANGLNLKDIGLLKYRNIVKDEIHFVREKSKNSTREDQKTIQIVITPELKEIVKKWGSKPRLPDNYIFDILVKGQDSSIQVYKDVNNSLRTINKYMKRISQTLELENIPTTNFARHSFATVLKRAGVGIEMISEQLGHSSIKTTEIYLGSFEKEQRKEVTKHLSAFKNLKIPENELEIEK